MKSEDVLEKYTSISLNINSFIFTCKCTCKIEIDTIRLHIIILIYKFLGYFLIKKAGDEKVIVVGFKGIQKELLCILLNAVASYISEPLVDGHLGDLPMLEPRGPPVNMI